MADNIMDFSERCRLCIEPKRLSIDIFSEEGRRIRLKSKINKHLSLKISQSDRLPSQICYQCLFRLETWVSFKQLCLERDQVMKTWSQSFQDEPFCEVERTYNGEPGSKLRQSLNLASKTSRAHPYPTEGSQIDDAKSDNSVWEVVKVDDPDNGGCEASKNASLNNADNSISPETSNKKHDIIIRHKPRKPSKVRSSGSDVSNSTDVDTSCTALLGFSAEHDSSPSLFSSVDHNKSSNSQDTFSTDASPMQVPLKRKRGRPSKASLLREREMKKLKDQGKVSGCVRENDFNDKTEIERLANDAYNDEIEEVATDETLNHEDLNDESMNGMVVTNEAATDEPCTLEDNNDEFIPDEEIKSATEPDPSVGIHSQVVFGDFAPIERDTGSGVTEVVLDDPEFGSMKFTLSVVEIDSPTSSPIPTDAYKYYSYAASSGNISSDSGHREDFEGFESPNSSCVMKPLLKSNASSSADDTSPSKSLDDFRTSEPESMNLSAGIKRKRSSSVSIDSKEISPSVENKSQHISKSLENVSGLGNDILCLMELEERNAHSEGEMSETTNKRFRRKPLFLKDLYDLK